ncbi:ADP-ribose-binding protein (plasmid) [Pontibacillus sp. ALD_SL1]|uniref:hypothetical protein n=1 Tax=Pontibacillus sp. ALD_SL1 TaxID=2777185 RepID=UPI001A95F8FB|nr:hypothetical protein [Pontibacillus sp. ALD_SL1]QST02294.1 ADP-ribose-binding protein [Pontibacillus sp. ALD_SL1]
MYNLYVGNPYETCRDGDTICVTTNGQIRKDGKAVMGRGSAKFARDTFGADGILAEYLKQYGNRAFILGNYPYKGKTITLVSFPTKHHWRDKSDIHLIEKSAEQLVEMADKFHLKRVYIPIPGCSNGELCWSDVKRVLKGLDERFIVYSLKEEDFNK